MRNMTLARFAGAIAMLAVAGGCTMKNQDAPPLAGPSELALAVNVTAVPDVITQDGASQSVVTATVRNASGQPVSGVPLLAQIFVNGVPVDFGRLSARNIATDSGGHATVVYTAPAPPPVSEGDGTFVTIGITPVGTDAANTNTRIVNVRLVPPGVILPPNGTPTADFAFTPDAPVIGEKIVFDGGMSSDPDGDPLSYTWAFSDGDRRSGQLVSIAFDVSGTYWATLTVTDPRGLSASTTKTFAVGIPADPTASFVFSPTEPGPGATVYFNASASRATGDRTIVSYAWDFGDGTTGSGATPTHVYPVAGKYTVVLVVTDNTGRRGTTSLVVEIGLP